MSAEAAAAPQQTPAEAPAAAQPVAANNEAASSSTEEKPAAGTESTNTQSAPDAQAQAQAAAAAKPATASQANAQQNATSLYVGELDPTVTEAMLYEIFSLIGPVSSIRVCRDAVTRRSLGYAYVNYLNSPDAERALEQLNYSLIKNKPCRIMVSQRDPALRKTGRGNVFLKNLDETIDNKALHDTFAAFGDILSCKVALDEHGNSKGYGFVHFTTGDAAQAAIDAVNGMLLNDKVVYVGHHVPKRERQAKIDEIRSQFTNLYVKNIPTEVDENELRELFSKYGTITSLVISRDNNDPSNASRGFGFVNFEKHEDARAAVDNLNEKDFKGQALYVSRAQKKGEREEELRKSYEQRRYEKNLKFQGVNLYVKNLDDEWDDEKVTAEFSPFGTITSCRVMKDDKGSSKGFGFVCYSSPDEASKAISELNGKMIGTKPLYVSLAQPKEIRQQQLSAQVAQREQIRSQQMAASGIPPQMPYMQPGAPMPYGYPGAGYPPAGRGGPMMGYPNGPNMMQRPRYAPGGMPAPMPGMPYPGYGAPYNGPQPAGRGMPPQGQYPRGGPNMRGGPNGAQGPAGRGMGSNRGQGYKLAAGARNAPAASGAPAAASGGSTLTAESLAAAAPEERKQMLGEALYPRIHETVPELAGKITGMLLEMDNAELLHLLEDEEALSGKVNEAIQVLEDYSKNAPGKEETAEPAAAA